MKYDLKERLINYSVLILDIVEAMPNNKGANHLAWQIIRSGTAPALMYGEAQSSESRKDFVHKMRLPLKSFVMNNESRIESGYPYWLSRLGVEKDWKALLRHSKFGVLKLTFEKLRAFEPPW
jgi:hypothetical protein